MPSHSARLRSWLPPCFMEDPLGVTFPVFSVQTAVQWAVGEAKKYEAEFLTL